jgi:hypothetical protein
VPPTAGLHGVDDGLHADLAVLEDEGVDAVVDLVPTALGAPLQVEHVLREHGFEVPLRLRHIGQQLGEHLPGAVLAAVDLLLHHQDRVVGVVGDDLLEVLGSQRLPVMGKHLLRRARAHGRPLSSV